MDSLYPHLLSHMKFKEGKMPKQLINIDTEISSGTKGVTKL